MNSVARPGRAKVGRILLWGILLVPILYVSTCSYVSYRKATAFDAINVGDAEGEVVRVLGSPSVREKAGDPPFGRYSSKACTAPCTERLWFENRLGFDKEAWSIDLDLNRRVMDKARWMSP
nr:hypothetical protein [Stenotrophomonas acidaminiphila]